MKKIDYDERKKKEAIIALKRLIKLIEKGIFVPYSMGLYQSGLDNHIHARFEMIDTDFPANNGKIQRDLENL